MDDEVTSAVVWSCEVLGEDSFVVSSCSLEVSSGFCSVKSEEVSSGSVVGGVWVESGTTVLVEASGKAVGCFCCCII